MLCPSEQVGPYTLLEEVGRGGMGSVWVAKQSKPMKRKVAIKLIKAGMDSRKVLARFGAERQTLAIMDHPNIVRVVDGGVTDYGRPFFAMEYVNGVPLTKYCDEAKLTVRERLELFIPICQAVQHAHRKGIVHRDLKPSNILVCLNDGKAVPKIIDFGLAKAMNYSLTDESVLTAHGVAVGTPCYMSPEQAGCNNLDVDARTDIYALGVILYELLTGSTPLERGRIKTASYDEVHRMIKELAPPKPSSRLSGNESLSSVAAQRRIEPCKLTRHIRGDLDWVVMKALDRERSRRYHSANELAEDVRRYLSEMPVTARPPSVCYCMQSFVKRNFASVLMAGCVGIFVAVSIGTIAWLWAQREAALNQLAQDRKDARVVTDLLETVLHSLSPDDRAAIAVSQARHLLRSEGGAAPSG